MEKRTMLFVAAGAGALLAACGAADGTGVPPVGPSPPGQPDWVEAKLATSSTSCAGQRALVPRTATALATLTPATSETARSDQPGVYAAYAVHSDGLFAYFSFDPRLPHSNIATDTARGLLKYAYVSFAIRQPAEVGGSLTVLDSSDLLELGDFERFEVDGDQLRWRLVRRSANHYGKLLSIYDQDPTNDPPSGDTCLIGDIAGECRCEFSGPPVTVTLEGTTPLGP